jgi:elongation factor Ts
MSAQLVKELRERSGAGMMDCKRALDENGGNMEAAIDWLRKKGLAAAAKKSGRVAAEGLVAVAGNGTEAAVVELNSETDFVARNEQFQALVEAVAHQAVTAGDDIEKLKASKLASGKTVAEATTEAVATIGENMSLRRSAKLSVAAGIVATYVHGAVKAGLGKIGVLVALESTGDKAKLEALGKQIAMHIAASNPQYTELSSIPADVIAKEKEVSKTKAEKLFADFTAFEASMQKYKDKFTGKERNFSEKTFEPKLKEFNQRAVNLDSLIDDVVTKSASEDRQDKQDAEKTQKLLNVFFEEVAFMIKKVRSYGDDAASKTKLADIYYNETLRDSVLFEQIFVIDGKTKIADVIANASSDVGAPVALKGYIRFALGEGIEKAADDFAAEVAKVSGVA